MMLLRFIVLAGIVVAIGLYAPMRATAANPAPASFEQTAQKEGEVPRPRPTPGPQNIVRAADFDEQKTETPPRPRPKPGPKDGGEDE